VVSGRAWSCFELAILAGRLALKRFHGQ
jgi:hypothetical protein